MTPAAVPAALSMRTDTEMLLGESLPCGTTMTVHRRCCSMPAPELMGPHQGLSSATRGHNCPTRSGHPRKGRTRVGLEAHGMCGRNRALQCGADHWPRGQAPPAEL